MRFSVGDIESCVVEHITCTGLWSSKILFAGVNAHRCSSVDCRLKLLVLCFHSSGTVQPNLD
jgi:hypothetical protein